MNSIPESTKKRARDYLGCGGEGGSGGRFDMWVDDNNVDDIHVYHDEECTRKITAEEVTEAFESGKTFALRVANVGEGAYVVFPKEMELHDGDWSIAVGDNQVLHAPSASKITE